MFKLKDIKANGGITLNKQGEAVAYKRGYQVSECDLYIVPAYRLTKKELLATLNQLGEGKCLGVWLNGGKAYVDCSEYVSTKKQAMKLGKERHQLSIWNWKASEAIAC